MDIRDILTIVASEQEDAHVLSCACQIAKQESAHLSALVVGWKPSSPYVVQGRFVDPLWSDIFRHAEQDLKVEQGRVQLRLERERKETPCSAVFLERDMARSALGMAARHSDLIVVGRPSQPTHTSHHAFLEAPLFESGRPVLIVPPGWTPGVIGHSILIGWKPTREAARALGDAAGLMAKAKRVTVLTVDAAASEDGYASLAGGEVVAHLARRNQPAEFVNAASHGLAESKAILDQARAVDADLIIMGGYGRSRASEWIFGGVTRDILKASTVPILMAH